MRNLKILLIDNGTVHIEALKKALEPNLVETITKDQINIDSANTYDLIVMSGSTNNAVVKNPDIYYSEIELIKQIKKPLLGICMGFEVIAYTFGAKFLELSSKVSGPKELTITKDDALFKEEPNYTVMENHKWVVLSIQDPMIELARSDTGIEIIKHADKPIYGFQFHPEILDDRSNGHRLLENFLSQI